MAGSRLVRAVWCTAVVVLLPSIWPHPARAIGTLGAAPWAASSEVYVAPVDGPVTDPFRPPPTPYGRGNRGIEYATVVGSAVHAAGAGEVIFAGSVAGGLHVTIRHDDGLRTSYSFLASLAVRAGTRVEQGAEVGRSGPMLHFGVRDTEGGYLDPALLFAGDLDPAVRLVPGHEEGVGTLRAQERQGFLALASERLLRALPGVGGGPGSLAVVGHYLQELQLRTRWSHLIEGVRRWRDNQEHCTPSDTAVPPPTERRLLVLVAGFASTSDGAGVDQVDHATLGYDDRDVLRFSYNGGRIPSAGLRPTLAALPASAYDAADSQRDLVVAADRLRLLLADVAAAEPGVPIDVVAHSQGGVVSRLAVLRADATGTLPADVATLVTLSSPHGGDDLATALHAITRVAGADQTVGALQSVLGLQLDANSAAVAEMSEVSPLTLDLADRGVPDHLNFVSVGARGDLVVASPRTAVAGEPSVIVDVTGIHTHDLLPGTTAATREIGLARAGLGPTCSGLLDAGLDLLMGESISWATDQVGATGLVLTAALP